MPDIIVAIGVDKGATRTSDTAVIDNVTRACSAVEKPCECDQRFQRVNVTREEELLPKNSDAITETGQTIAQQREQVRIRTGRQANARQERQMMI